MELRDPSARHDGSRRAMPPEPRLHEVGEGERELVMKKKLDLYFGDFLP